MGRPAKEMAWASDGRVRSGGQQEINRADYHGRECREEGEERGRKERREGERGKEGEREECIRECRGVLPAG
jgi:hypothetical protein